MRNIRSLFAVAVMCAGFAVAASAAPHGVYWVKGQKPVGPTDASGRLLYYGGPVISHAKVYAVFWGNGVDQETQSNIGPFFSNILDSSYMDWLKEYNTDLKAVDGRDGTHQTIGRGTFAGSVTIHPTNTTRSLTDAMIQQELEAQINAHHLAAPDADSLYMIYFPSGFSISIENMRSCSTFCAYHEGFKAKTGASIFYGVMPVCGFGCGMSGNAFNDLSVVSSHEAIEAVTDPFPTPGNSPAYPQAWNTTGGEEIGDLCAQTSSTVSGHGISSAVQGEWDNASNSCNQGPWGADGSFAGLHPMSVAPNRISEAVLEQLVRARTAASWDGRR